MVRYRSRVLLLLAIWVSAHGESSTCAVEPLRARGNAATVEPTAAERGFQFLTRKAYLPADFDQEVFDNLWKVWPEPLRAEAAKASVPDRRRLAFTRYGLTARPEPASDGSPLPLGYVTTADGKWVMNCLACHTGRIEGEVYLGSGNSLTALQTLTDDVRIVKLQQGKALTHLDLGSVRIPLGTTNGTTNAVIFGVALGSLRDKDLNVVLREPPPFIHHDLDAPAFWNVKHKTHLYADGFVPKGHRPLLQFVMLPVNKADRLKSWEPDFADILAWIESLQPPKYPHPVDTERAEAGKRVFLKRCAECHGTYGDTVEYPNRLVPIGEVNTDDTRLRSLPKEYRQALQDGWFGHYGEKPHRLEPGGYVAPPLTGLWATAPYLHNGSVPTLWHLLHPSERPRVWRRIGDRFDKTSVGLAVEVMNSVPESVKSAADRRTYFDTTKPGKSAQGHTFPEKLTPTEKLDLLEYLKTL